MHKVLELHELIELIVAHLEDSTSLARFARVCKAFWEPCVRRLWCESPYGLDPLNALMELEWYPTPSPNHEHRAPTHIEMYASFIRSIFGTIHPRYGGLIPDEHRKVDIFMPKYPVELSLYRIAVGLETEPAVEAIGRLLSPSISDLEVFVPAIVSLESYMKFFHSLPDRVPDVGRLHLTAALLGRHDDTKAVQPELIRTLVRFNQLEELHLDVEASDELLSCLAGLELFKLGLTYIIRSELSPYNNAPRIPPFTFETLYSLELLGQGYSCVYLMERVSLPVISSLTFHIPIFREDEITNLCSLIIRTADTLQFLRVTSLGHRKDTKTFPVSCFSSLYRCAHLEWFQLSGGRPGKDRLVWQREDILLTAQSWKRMEYLALVPESTFDPDQPFQPLISVHDLLPLAEHCPQLKQLAVSVDLSVPVTIPLPPLTTNSPRVLEVLKLHESCIPPPRDEMTSVAATLLTLWPDACLYLDGDLPSTLMAVFQVIFEQYVQ